MRGYVRRAVSILVFLDFNLTYFLFPKAKLAFVSILVFLDFNRKERGRETENHRGVSILVFLDFNQPLFSVLFLIIVCIIKRADTALFINLSIWD